MSAANNSDAPSSDLEVKTFKTFPLWENQEGTKCLRATVASFNDYPRVTIGKFFRIVDVKKAKELNRPFNTWMPEKKGKHICLSLQEFKGLLDVSGQVYNCLDEVETNYAAKPRSSAGFGYANQGPAAHSGAAARFGPPAPYNGKKRGRKPKNCEQADSEEDSSNEPKRKYTAAGPSGSHAFKAPAAE